MVCQRLQKLDAPKASRAPTAWRQAYQVLLIVYYIMRTFDLDGSQSRQDAPGSTLTLRTGKRGGHGFWAELLFCRLSVMR